MRIISWNIRGTQKRVIARWGPWLLNTIRIFSTEIRVNSHRACRIIERTNWPNFVEFPPEEFSGGIWLIWKSNADFKINTLKTHVRIVHCQNMDNKKNIHQLEFFFYGYPKHQLQNHLWKEISSLNDSCTEQWMIIDGLNELSNSQDKFENHKGNSTHFNKFKPTLNENSLIDICYVGLSYTR